MIWESEHWRRDLVRVAGRLKTKMQQRRWIEASFALVERDVMLSAYVVRKLADAKKLTTGLLAQSFAVKRFPLREDRIPDLMNWYHLERFYDLGRGTTRQLSVAQLVNQLIHSWVFIVVREADGGLAGVYVSSDRKRSKELYFIDICVLIEIFDRAGSEKIVALTMSRNDEGEWQITSTRAAPQN